MEAISFGRIFAPDFITNPKLNLMKERKSKRVVGSAEVVTDENGNLIATNFRAYKKTSCERKSALDTLKTPEFTLYEYLEHYVVAISLKKGTPNDTRSFISRALNGLNEVEQREKPLGAR